MADIGFKASASGKDVRKVSGANLAFTSSHYIDKIMAIAIGVNLPHGLSYKPTLLTSNSTGGSLITGIWVDNYQIHNVSTLLKGIALSQQGT